MANAHSKPHYFLFHHFHITCPASVEHESLSPNLPCVLLVLFSLTLHRHVSIALLPSQLLTLFLGPFPVNARTARDQAFVSILRVSALYHSLFSCQHLFVRLIECLLELQLGLDLDTDIDLDLDALLDPNLPDGKKELQKGPAPTSERP